MIYRESKPVVYFKANWKEFKGETFSHKCKTFVEGEGLVPAVEKITISGIGKQAIKYHIDGKEDEPQYARYDNGDANGLVSTILTCPEAGENPFWNKEIVSKVIAQRYFILKDKGGPYFAPKDGFCWSCGEQIYERISWKQARHELITGCPHCSRSYCD